MKTQTPLLTTLKMKKSGITVILAMCLISLVGCERRMDTNEIAEENSVVESKTETTEITNEGSAAHDEPYIGLDINSISTEPLDLPPDEPIFTLVRKEGTEDIPTVSAIRLLNHEDYKRIKQENEPIMEVGIGEELTGAELNRLDELGVKYEVLYTKREEGGFLLITPDVGSNDPELVDYYDPTLFDMVEPPQLARPEIAPDEKGLYMVVANTGTIHTDIEKTNNTFKSAQSELFSNYEIIVIGGVKHSDKTPLLMYVWCTLNNIQKAVDNKAIAWGGYAGWANRINQDGWGGYYRCSNQRQTYLNQNSSIMKTECHRKIMPIK